MRVQYNGHGASTMKILLTLMIVLCYVQPLHARRSIIIEAKGQECAPKGAFTAKTEEQSLNNAIADAHRRVVQYVLDLAGLKDTSPQGRELTELYTQAPVMGLQVLKKRKSGGYASGRKCAYVDIKAQIAPDEKVEARLQQLTGEGATAPLLIKVWTERKVYYLGETVKFFVQANKPFYGSILYKDAANGLSQIFPNEYHRDSYFESNKVYTFPTEGEYGIKVAPPAFGEEWITVYAATAPLDYIADIVATGGGNSDRVKYPLPKAGTVIEYVDVSTTLTTKE